MCRRHVVVPDLDAGGRPGFTGAFFGDFLTWRRFAKNLRKKGDHFEALVD